MLTFILLFSKFADDVDEVLPVFAGVVDEVAARSDAVAQLLDRLLDLNLRVAVAHRGAEEGPDVLGREVECIGQFGDLSLVEERLEPNLVEFTGGHSHVFSFLPWCCLGEVRDLLVAHRLAADHS